MRAVLFLTPIAAAGTTLQWRSSSGDSWIGIDITVSVDRADPQTASEHLRGKERGRRRSEYQARRRAARPGSSVALANRKDDKTRKEFEKWAILTFSKNQARINEKKGADAGIDGVAFFLIGKDKNGRAMFQVKSQARHARRFG